MPEWTAAGYDLVRQDRWVYAFLAGDGAEVKMGMVGAAERLAPRLREVAVRHHDPDLRMVARVAVPDVDSQTVEHVEAVIRHWLVAAATFEHAGRVDWLKVADPPPADWQQLLEDAVAFALDTGVWRRPETPQAPTDSSDP